MFSRIVVHLRVKLQFGILYDIAFSFVNILCGLLQDPIVLLDGRIKAQLTPSTFPLSIHHLLANKNSLTASCLLSAECCQNDSDEAFYYPDRPTV